MTTSSLGGVRVAGICSAVPERVVANTEAGDRFGADEVQKIIKSTGIATRRVASETQCTSDLCLAAAQKLLVELEWAKDSIDALVFVSQSTDYLLPATACLIQDRLGLRRTCAALDITLGCSGYAYGMWVASSLLASGACKRILLLVGEIATRRVGPGDRSAALLFGDAGTATAMEVSPGAPPLHFTLGTDGSGGEHLVIPAGGSRMLPAPETLETMADADGNRRTLGDCAMNGVEIFIFSTREVPPLVRESLALAGLTVDTVDAVVFHQANEFMLKHIARTLKLPMSKVPLSLREFGNTSSATIPLTMTEALAPTLRERPMQLVLAGFGVGFSWGAVSGSFGPMVIPDRVEVPADFVVAPFRGGLGA